MGHCGEYIGRVPAESPPTRALDGEKAQRIVAAMRASVAERGIAGATFDQVARSAGVSRGLLHYYFATKERLLAEVVRRDCDRRLELIDVALDRAGTAEELLQALVGTLEDLLDHDPGFYTLLYELFVAGRRNDEVASELVSLMQRTRDAVGEGLARKQADGVVTLGGPPAEVATVLFSLADGLAIRMLSEPGADRGPLIATALVSARALVREPG